MARRRHSNRRRRRGNFGFLYKLLSVLVICAAVVMALTLFFRVDTIEVTGTERYTGKGRDRGQRYPAGRQPLSAEQVRGRPQPRGATALHRH